MGSERVRTENAFLGLLEAFWRVLKVITSTVTEAQLQAGEQLIGAEYPEVTIQTRRGLFRLTEAPDGSLLVAAHGGKVLLFTRPETSADPEED